jgi:hypothetical protein
LENWYVHEDFKEDLQKASKRLDTALKIGIKETMPGDGCRSRLLVLTAG